MSRESLACTRSTRPVTALTRSTTPASSSPPAWAWQVSRQKPMLAITSGSTRSSKTSQSRATRSSRRAIAPSPPAVFSMSTGSGGVPALEGLRPVVGAALRVVVLADVPAVHDQPLGADLGRRRRVLGQQLAAGDADPVVRRGDVEPVGRVHVEVDPGLPRRRRAGRPLPRRTPRPGPSSPAGRRGRSAPGRRRGRPPRRSGRPSRRGHRCATWSWSDPTTGAPTPAERPVDDDFAAVSRAARLGGRKHCRCSSPPATERPWPP